MFLSDHTTVKKSIYHIAVRILLIVVMFLTSTGFTTVVRYCSMTKSSVCCCESENSSASESTGGAPTIESPDSSCFSQKIAGGINNINAIMSQEALTKAVVLEVEAEAPVYQERVVVSHAPSVFLPEPSAGDSPGVDIYVRVNSFLI